MALCVLALAINKSLCRYRLCLLSCKLHRIYKLLYSYYVVRRCVRCVQFFPSAKLQLVGRTSGSLTKINLHGSKFIDSVFKAHDKRNVIMFTSLSTSLKYY